MSLTRRQFWRLAASGVVGAAFAAHVDLDKLLWVPGEKTIFLPPGRVFTGPHFLSAHWMAKEVLRMLVQDLRPAADLHRRYDDAYSDQFGSTVLVRKPASFGNGGLPLVVDCLQPVTLTKQFFVEHDWRSSDETLPVEAAQFHAQSIGRRLAAQLNAHQCDVFGKLPLPRPDGGVAVTATDRKTGASVRVVRSYDIGTDTWRQRYDVLGGATGMSGRGEAA